MRPTSLFFAALTLIFFVIIECGWVYGRLLTGIGGSNPTGGMDVCLLRVLCVVR
jgi:hypothetical protein